MDTGKKHTYLITFAYKRGMRDEYAYRSQLDLQLHCVIAERTIHLLSRNGWVGL